MTRIIGIDPGSQRTGVGIIDVAADGRVSPVWHGPLVLLGADDFPLRLKTLALGLRDLVAQYRPDEVAIEKVFMGKNADSALKLGQARGAAIVAATQHQIKVSEYSATQIKSALVGSGRAAKEQVQVMVMHLLKLTEKPQIDASDALAVALCHAHHRQTLIPHNLGGARRRGGRLRLASLPEGYVQ